MFRFLLVTIAAAGILAGGIVAGVSLGWWPHYPTFYIHTTILLVFATVVIYYYLLKIGQTMFVQFFLLSMVLKLLAFAGYNLVIILKDRPGAIPNVVYFMVAYGVFTVIEITFLFRHVNRRS